MGKENQQPKRRIVTMSLRSSTLRLSALAFYTITASAVIRATIEHDHRGLMGLLEIIVLAIVQGLTEFMPISSTAHLRIVPALLGWSDPGAAFSAVIQIGTLVAVLSLLLARRRADSSSDARRPRPRQAGDHARCTARLDDRRRHAADHRVRRAVQRQRSKPRFARCR